MTREHRQLPRTIPAELGFIQISRDDGGRILNISQGGLCFETFAPIEREKVLRFWFSLNLRERIEASGNLAWLDGDDRVGGLRFVDLSPRAQRHLRTHLGTDAGSGVGGKPSARRAALLAALAKLSQAAPAAEPQTSDNGAFTGVFQEANSVATHWFPDPTAQSVAGSDLADRTDKLDKDELPNKGKVFFAALAAERARGERANEREIADTAVLEEASLTAWDPSDEMGAAGEPGATLASTDFVGAVPFEPHLNASRRQFKTVVLLEVLFLLAVGIVAGGYFIQRQTDSEAAAGAAAAVAGTPSPEAGTQVGSDASEGSATPISPQPEAHPRPIPSHYAPDNRARKSGTTPEQLWAAVGQGNTKATVELADRFLQGDGVPVNCAQARVLLLVASKKKSAEATRKLRELDKTGCTKP